MGEYNLELEDRLYTSTEVAKILGVSLRSVYRYLEDKKLVAEMKTATGRHRFTKQNILDFLYPQKTEEEKEEDKEDKKEVEETKKAEEKTKKETKEDEEKTEEVEEEVEDEKEEKVDEETEDEETEEDDDEVDWLSKFRKAAEKYKAETEEEETKDEDEKEEETEKGKREKVKKEKVSGLADETEKEEVEEEDDDSADRIYYSSEVGGLKEVAQKLDKSAKKASLSYAFTMQAGLSLHKPISPFSLIHAYVNSEDLPFFEKILNLTKTDKDDAQLCLIVSDEDSIYDNINEMHGLNLVSNKRLKKDLVEAGEEELAEKL